MSPADFLFFRLQHMLTKPVACELQRCATIALALFMRPLDRCASHFIIPLWLHLMFYTEPSNGFLHNLKVKLLFEDVEREPEPETIGQGYFFLHRFTVMNFIMHHFGAEIVSVELGEKMPAIGGHVDQDVLW